MKKRLRVKVAIITGSTSGIGKATAELFAEEGAKVVVSASGRRPGLGEEVVEGIENKGGVAAWCKADVNEAEDIQNLIRFSINRFGSLHILINNAYGGKHGSVLELSENDLYILIFSLNLSWFISLRYIM